VYKLEKGTLYCLKKKSISLWRKIYGCFYFWNPAAVCNKKTLGEECWPDTWWGE